MDGFQGAEYLALKGMGKLIRNIDIIHTEAEIFEIYSEQYYFKDIKKILKRNFVLVSGNKNHPYFDNFIFINKTNFFKFIREYVSYSKNNLLKKLKLN